tara:strand:+ start:163 stop:552 length:390 start_codon:yes stop_codon:yes gene_type:complete
MGYKLKTVNTKKSPQAIGPYSQAKIVNNLVFTSGQIPLKVDGEIIENDFELECKQVLANLEEVLLESGSGLDGIIKLTVYLTDLNKFGILNEIFKEYFNQNLPARSTVEVSKLPMNARVEIEAVGLIND